MSSAYRLSQSDPDVVTPRDFMDAVVSFRNHMSDKRLTAEQRQNGFKMVGLMYLRCQCSADEQDRIADIFAATCHEYQTRMRLMGMPT